MLEWVVLDDELLHLDVPELVALGVEAYAGAGVIRGRLLTPAQLRARLRARKVRAHIKTVLYNVQTVYMPSLGSTVT